MIPKFPVTYVAAGDREDSHTTPSDQAKPVTRAPFQDGLMRIKEEPLAHQVASNLVLQYDRQPLEDNSERLPSSLLREEVSHMTDDMSDLILQRGFGIDLADLSEPLDAWRCVEQCLQELSEVVDRHDAGGRHGTSDIPLHQAVLAASGGRNSDTAPVDRSGDDHRGGSGGRKRRPGQEEGNGNERCDDGSCNDDQDASREHAGGKRLKSASDDSRQRLSCPFRKRNKARFNYRDFESCAKPHACFSTLKRHVRNFHVRKRQQPLHKCPRCHAGFATEDECSEHVRLPPNQLCSVNPLPTESEGPDNPEDGISSQVALILAERKDDVKVGNWDGLWHTLFPADVKIPSSGEILPPSTPSGSGWNSILRAVFEPPIIAEIHEIETFLQNTKPTMARILQDRADGIVETINWGGHAYSTAIASSMNTAIGECLDDWLKQFKRSVIGMQHNLSDEMRSVAPSPRYRGPARTVLPSKATEGLSSNPRLIRPREAQSGPTSEIRQDATTEDDLSSWLPTDANLHDSIPGSVHCNWQSSMACIPSHQTGFYGHSSDHYHPPTPTPRPRNPDSVANGIGFIPPEMSYMERTNEASSSMPSSVPLLTLQNTQDILGAVRVPYIYDFKQPSSLSRDSGIGLSAGPSNRTSQEFELIDPGAPSGRIDEHVAASIGLQPEHGRNQDVTKTQPAGKVTWNGYEKYLEDFMN
ncbi:hypothetical protein BJ170DRAFT_722222 [Xylariales sp. AK1849]|nr:hypothetical protein BJ170DRAFT_722222 [Xylariales sp. AK1849]